MNLKLAKWINRWLSDDPDDHGGFPIPGTSQRLDLYWEDGNKKFYATTYNNDGFELWLGSPNKWWGFLRASDARKLAWFILWDWWAVGTWFGLKRKIWYSALHTICEDYKKMGPRDKYNSSPSPTAGKHTK